MDIRPWPAVAFDRMTGNMPGLRPLERFNGQKIAFCGKERGSNFGRIACSDAAPEDIDDIHPPNA